MHKLTVAITITFALFLLWVNYLANADNTTLSRLVMTVPYGDKPGHFLLIGTMAFLAISVTRFHTFTAAGIRIYSGAALILVLVTAEEISQLFNPARTFDLIDLAADILGVSAAISLTYLTKKRATPE